jgi:VanZ family protein
MISLARIFCWLGLIAVIGLSISPPAFRPVSSVPHLFEHLLAFFLLGSVFALAYPRHRVHLVLAAVPCLAGLELLQLLVAGRHARLSDFLVNLLGAYAGLVLGHWRKVSDGCTPG